MKLIAYHRVSTAKQGQSGLGLEAQAAAIRSYAERKQGQVLATFTEVESGKSNERPELAKALHLARVTGATLVIAKLDRLSQRRLSAHLERQRREVHRSRYAGRERADGWHDGGDRPA